MDHKSSPTNVTRRPKKISSNLTRTKEDNKDHALGVIGDELWVLSKTTELESLDSLQVPELKIPLQLTWSSECSTFLAPFLAGHNLLANGDFGGSGIKSLSHWLLDAESSAGGGIDLSREWRVASGHTAFLTAPKNDPRPRLICQQKIPLMGGDDLEYRFCGYFASHRADGLISLLFYDANDKLLDEQTIIFTQSAQFEGGPNLSSYAFIDTLLTLPATVCFVQIHITLSEQIDATFPDAYLFFTKLYLGIADEEEQIKNTYSPALIELLHQALSENWQLFGVAILPSPCFEPKLSINLEDTHYDVVLNKSIARNVQTMPSSNIFDEADIGAFAVDRAVVIENDGLLLYGWRYLLSNQLCSIHLCTPKGGKIDLTQKLFAISRKDLVLTYRNRYPEITEYAGFICYVPLAVKIWQTYTLDVTLNSGQTKQLKLPIVQDQHQGLSLIKDLLNWVPAPERIRPQLFNLFDQHLGQAIACISKNIPAFTQPVYQQQFGTAPTQPSVSVIVPLYGRYDFVRYQLSHFANDPEFQQVDLIYVIDDVAISSETNELAAMYAPVFKVPFRTIWYESNLGFAGANNIGAQCARADTLLLLNSDVLPKKSGWLSVLAQALAKLPDAGAVGPLLQFTDDSIQHAGMISKSDARFPGFLLNNHPNKGQFWPGDDKACEVPMLTAACLMIKKQNYHSVGGLDEGYIIGDFEDSDLCLALRKQGKRLWLVPTAKLWHLERQSQNLDNLTGFRHLLTLYNGWRFQQKVQQGVLADPTQIHLLEG